MAVIEGRSPDKRVTSFFEEFKSAPLNEQFEMVADIKGFITCYLHEQSTLRRQELEQIDMCLKDING